MADPRTERTARAVASWQPRTIYLTAYNILFASLWASVFVRAVSSAPTGRIGLFHATEAYARWIQTASLMEVLHAAFGMFIMVYPLVCSNVLLRVDESGIIKSPVSTTAIQVVTRVIQVWMVWYSFPQSTATSHAYLALLLAWSVADTIRYLYLALNMHGKAPKGLVWLRYVLLQSHLLSWV
jgi:very-long-chain (3R)-3-hydroxyacyl-CoA dehydratase